MLDLVWLIPALPLLGFLLILLFGRRLGEPRAGYLATAMCGGAFVVAVGVFLDLLSKTAEERQHVVTLWSWLPVGSLHVDVAFLADPLSDHDVPVRHRRRHADPPLLRSATCTGTRSSRSSSCT